MYIAWLRNIFLHLLCRKKFFHSAGKCIHMRKYFPAWPRPRFAVGKITLRLGNFQLILIELFCWWKLALWWDLVGIIFTSRRDNFSHMNSPLQAFGKGNLKRYRHECSPLNLLHIFRTPFPKSTSDGLL